MHSSKVVEELVDDYPSGAAVWTQVEGVDKVVEVDKAQGGIATLVTSVAVDVHVAKVGRQAETFCSS